jgi:hypothetical protein
MAHLHIWIERELFNYQDHCKIAISTCTLRKEYCSYKAVGMLWIGREVDAEPKKDELSLNPPPFNNCERIVFL